MLLLVEEGFNVTAEVWQTVLDHAPNGCVTYPLVLVDEDITEVDDRALVADPGGQIGVALPHPCHRLANDPELALDGAT